MKKSRVIVSITIVLVTVLSSLFFYIGKKNLARADSLTFTINGKTFPTNEYPADGRNPYCNCGISVGSGTHGCCWAYAKAVYQYLWGTSFYRSDANNMLSELSAEERKLTGANLRKYLEQAKPGANVRLDSNLNMSSDSEEPYGHSLIFLGFSGSDGNTAYFAEANSNGHGNSRIKAWNLDQLASKYNKRSLTYIKYIIWPNAAKYQSVISVTSIPEGKYYIYSAIGGKVLQIDPNNQANGSRASVHAPTGITAQVFDIKYNSAKQGYFLKTYCSGKVLDSEGNLAEPTNIQQWELTGTGNQGQNWYFESAGGDWYYIKNQWGKYLTVGNSDYVRAEACTRADAQKWRLAPASGIAKTIISSGNYVITSKIGGKVLDVSNGHTDSSDGRNVQIYSPLGNGAQYFAIGNNTSLPYNANYIALVASGKFVTTQSNSTSRPANVVQFHGDGSAGQQWFFEKTSDGYYYIRDMLGGYLTVHEGKNADAVNVEVDKFNGSDKQKWKPLPSSQKPKVTIDENDENLFITAAMEYYGWDAEIVGYYFGTKSNITDNPYTKLSTPTTAELVVKDITEPGKYYIAAKDSYGRLSDTVSTKTYYRTTFSVNNGSVTTYSELTQEGKTIYLPTPVMSGAKFSGWYTKSDFSGSALSGTYKPTSNATLYARWDYTVTFNANGGEGGPVSQTKIRGIDLVLSTSTPSKTGFDFLGWATSSNATTAQYKAGGKFTTNANTTLYAVWSKKKYQIQYDANGGTGAPSAQTKTYGETLTLSTTEPSKEGFDFLGWATSSTATTAQYAAGGKYTANAAATLYAVWSKKTFAVKYDANGGTGAPPEQTKKYGEALTLSTTIPSKTGYDFLGWATSSTATTAQYTAGGKYTANSAATLYAVWSEKKYTVKFDANGGTGAPSPQTKKYGVKLQLSTTEPSKEGFRFLGWATTADASEASYAAGGYYTDNADITLYAVWIRSSFLISYDANGGTGAPEAQKQLCGETITITDQKPKKTDMVFTGWATGKSDTVVKYHPGDAVSFEADTTLYAVYEKKASCKGYFVDLSDKINLRFCFDIEDDLFDRNVYAVVSFADGSEAFSEIKIGDGTEVSGQVYYITEALIAPKNLSDDITTRIIVGDGSYNGGSVDDFETAATAKWSVKEYCEALTKSDSYPETARKLAEAVLTYSTYSQLYFNYNTSSLSKDVEQCNLRSAESVLSDLDSVSPVITSLTDLPEGIHVVGCSLILESSLICRLYFTLDDGVQASEYGLKEKPGEGGFYLEKKVANPARLNEDLPFAVGNGVVKFNPMSYVKNSLLNGQNKKLKDLCVALYEYYFAAKTYINYENEVISEEDKYAPFSTNWVESATGYTISIKRTSSKKGAALGTIHSGDTVYEGDVLKVTYTPATGYSITAKGVELIEVAGDVTTASVFAKAQANEYTYNIVYKSSDGTSLGSTTATYRFGTTNKITAPAKVGYETPAAQNVAWDSTTAKTITFTYTVIASYKVTWSTGTGYSIAVKRTSSKAGASTGALSSGATVYKGDVLAITYTASTGYSISTKGKESVTVSGNVTSSDIYATALGNEYTYNVVYKSSDGTSLGSTTVKYRFGTTNKITAPAKLGYETPAAQNVAWDSTSAKTITFTYTVIPAYKVTWSTGTGYTIAVKRTSSKAGASTGALSSGATVYKGDVLAVTYAATTGYSISSKGKESITVSGNVTASDIFAKVLGNEYTYNVVYKSTNGTALGTATVKYRYGTTNTISAPAKTGYNTPSSQSVKWDSTTAKTITFEYKPTPVSGAQTLYSVDQSTVSGLEEILTIKAEVVSRSASSVRVKFTYSFSHKGYTDPYSYVFDLYVNGKSYGITRIVTFGTWKDGHTSTETASCTVDIPLSTTAATTAAVTGHLITRNYYDNDYPANSTYNISTTPVKIPAY